MENSNSKQFVVLERIAGENARDYVKRVLLYNLTELILKPGEQIQDIEICEKLGVSRTPVREAILEFSQFNMIDIFPRRGMRVALIDPVKCEDGRYLRCLVEADLSEQACDLINAQFLEKFHVSVSLLQYYEKKDFYKFFEYDIEFHKLLYLLCNKEYLYNLVSRACMHFDRLRRLRFLINDPKW